MTNGDDPNKGGSQLPPGQQPGTPPGQQPVPPQGQQPGYPPAQQPGYPPAQQPGYPPAPPAGYPSAGAGSGYPPPGYQPGMQPMQPPAGQDLPRPGFLMPGIWLGVSILVTLLMAAYVGLSAAGSETAGVLATRTAAFPLGMVWAGCITALAVHLFYKKGSKGIRVGVPIGCGCLGGLIMFGLIIVFFVAIFPAL